MNVHDVNTFEDYITCASWYNGDGWQRAGQRYSNVLQAIRPQLHNMVKYNDLDPFYLDERIPAFLDFVMRKWDERPVTAERPQ